MSDPLTGRAVRRPAIVVGVDTTGDPVHVVVRLTGEVDQLNVADLGEAVEPWLRTGVADITIDLRDVVFIDSAGIGRVVRLWKRGRAVDVPVRLVVRHAAVVALLEVTGVGSFIDVTVVPDSPVA